MKRTFKLIIVLIIMIALFGISNKVEAASTTFELSAKEVNVGDTITLTATVTAAQWDLGITLNGKTLATSSELDNYESNITKTFTATYKATTEGKLTFTLKGDATDVSQKVEKINKSVTVNVKKVEVQKPTPEPEKPTTPSTTTPSNPPTTKPSTPTTPEKPKVEEKPNFTETNKKMYAENDINLRANWSTSSKATKIEKGTELTVTATSNNKVNGYVWYRVSYNGQTKYVASNLLSTIKPEEEPEQPVEEPKEETPEEPTATVDEPEENTETTDELKGLKSLEVEGLTLSPKFETGTYNYEAILKKNITELKINTQTIEEDGTVVVAGNTNIQEGENLITIIVYNAKGEAVATYQIIVNKNTLDLTSTDELLKYGNQATTLKTTIYMIAIIVTTILLITVLIARYKTQNQKEEIQFEQEEKPIKENEEKFAIKEEKKGKHF